MMLRMRRSEERRIFENEKSRNPEISGLLIILFVERVGNQRLLN